MNRPTSLGRRGRKYDQVLEGARRVFMKDGFDNANVDEIAKEAGVSKATLYSYFPDKRLLFIEIARCECHKHSETSRGFVPPNMPPEELLPIAARRMVTGFTSPMAISMFRLAAAESNRFPDLSQDFYEAGPMTARRIMSRYIREATERGYLNAEDPELAADQFIELCRARIMTKMLFGVLDAVPAEEVELIADEAVKTFMARYGVEKAE